MEDTKLSSPTSNLAFIKIIDDNSLPDLESDLKILRFHYMPDSIKESKSATWDKVAILGRSEPIRFYGSSNTRTISLNLSFHVRTEADFDVEASVTFLRSLVYPDYSDSAKAAFSPLPPPVILLKIGSWLSMRSIVTSVDVTRYGPWSADDLMPNRADVSLQIEELSIRPSDVTDVIFGDDMTEAPIQSSTDGVASSSGIPSSNSALGASTRSKVASPSLAETSALDSAIPTVT